MWLEHVGGILVSLILIGCGITRGTIRNLAPFWTAQSPQDSWLAGSFWIFSSCAFFLNGWQTALHAIEERKASVTARSATCSK
jgi:hypothetical protein